MDDLQKSQKAPTPRQVQILEEAGQVHQKNLTRGEAADLIAELRAV